VRLFIFFHDCCHGSFFASPRANRILGRLLGVIFFTSFDEFRYTHGRHHATVGDLDRRGTGDVWTMTAEEYLSAPRYKRIAYRIYREPLIMFGLGPLFTFLGVNLIPDRKLGKPRFWGVVKNDIGIAILATILCLTIGWQSYLLIQVPVILIAGMIGIWLFYVQHQFEPSYWARHDEWDSIEAALKGSSFYRLPKVLQWATGNIGLHHIHHLRLHLWDEANRRLISFRQLHQQKARANSHFIALSRFYS
jgi:omega-6 fatty acid desaturase (delta-12 desaturase)